MATCSYFSTNGDEGDKMLLEMLLIAAISTRNRISVATEREDVMHVDLRSTRPAHQR